MANKYINIDLDFMEKSNSTLFTVKQFDDVSIDINTYMNDVQYDPMGNTCKLFVALNKDVYLQDKNIQVLDNKISIKLDRNIISSVGLAYAELELSNSAGTISSTTFIFSIVDKIGEGAKIPGGTEGFVERYERLIAEFKTQVNSTVNDCNNRVDNKLSQLQIDYDSTKNEVITITDNKIDEIETRFNQLTSSQQGSSEVIDARDGEVNLKARLERDLVKGKIHFEEVEGSYISTDSEEGYIENLEIKGNTIQDANNLSDIRSVGDKVEGQELYKIPLLCCGKNLFDGVFEFGVLTASGTLHEDSLSISTKNFIKVNSNVNYTFNRFDTNKTYQICFYDANKIFISRKSLNDLSSTTQLTPSNCKYIKFSLMNVRDLNTKAQLEEGTQATPYEPYQEHKITILSPTQIEKVGDVADRIIEKDGVCGVEKNIVTRTINQITSDYAISPFTNTVRFHIEREKILLNSKIIGPSDINGLCNQLAIRHMWEEDVEGFYADRSLCFRLNLNKFNSVNMKGFNTYLSKNPLMIKYVTTQPQFIPLPHDQQIKLKTFAHKTNISLLCEIEGIIKGEVPKSLGATVNTHTTQIDNLNKELDRVKKLEESTVSTVETDKDLTVVEETSSGYFEDVKLEGRTLVNLIDLTSFKSVGSGLSFDGKSFTCTGADNRLWTSVESQANLKPNTLYTALAIGGESFYFYNVADSKKYTKGVYTFTTTTDLGCKLKYVGSVGDKVNFIILEGDHTQTPPAYFEGLASVGEGTDKIVVSSFGTNNLGLKGIYSNNGNIYGVVEPKPNKGFVLNKSNKIIILSLKNSTTWTRNIELNPLDSLYLENNLSVEEVLDEVVFKGSYGWGDVAINEIKEYIHFNSEPKADKKQLLYLDPQDNTWKKPVLREWDTVEKHSDGKYYYHKRSEQVVLNGSESWAKADINNYDSDNFITFTLPSSNQVASWNDSSKMICDEVPSKKGIDSAWQGVGEGICSDYAKILICISRAKLETPDLAGFKKWLQANNVTVVYQLAEEEVYECANIDLITCDGETNYIVESGPICPQTTLKVHNNISNVVTLLQKKVSLLEQNQINMFKMVLSGDMQSLAYMLYPQDFEKDYIMTLPMEP